ncbi:hypothetical protein L1987_02398 [Smallanthus sonchifolius]|uniref:Uncharacterized protein n=1 Tax=Smallanthus sonchifolius TaxID=185202 RepID=A0ACB9K7P3_9ASTR|nr:hypothetical protein L1987_02398 [Smallanthus sonchifolius]
MVILLGLFSLFLMIQNGHAYQFKITAKNNEKVVIVVLANGSNHTSDAPSSSPPATPPALPPTSTSEEFASSPPAPGAAEPDLNPAPAPHPEENPPPAPTPNAASSRVLDFFCFFGAYAGFSLLFGF